MWRLLTHAMELFNVFWPQARTVHCVTGLSTPGRRTGTTSSIMAWMEHGGTTPGIPGE